MRGISRKLGKTEPVWDMELALALPSLSELYQEQECLNSWQVTLLSDCKLQLFESFFSSDTALLFILIQWETHFMTEIQIYVQKKLLPNQTHSGFLKCN